ncbi:MAG: DNA polymerase IV [Nitrospira sp.]|jgi:DNA polymerase-4|nr:MAG: DNA polymerase IV [Nitrospira sp.]
MDRQIVCLAVPSFELTLARLNEPRLRDRPIGLAPVAHPRTLLHDVSPEAAADGLYPGMVVQQARQLCPALHVLTPDSIRTAQAHTMLSHIITRYTPVWESTSPGSFVLDLTGTTRLFGLTCDTAGRLQRDIAMQVHLDGMLGIGSNKLIAQTAAGLIQPTQIYEVRHGSERAFMAPLRIETLPLLHRPQMKSIRRCLADLNLRTFGDVADIPLPALDIAVGRWAAPLQRWAQGIDSTPVMPSQIQPRLEVSCPLRPDDIDDHAVWRRLAGLLEELCRALRLHQRTCKRLTLTIRYSDRTDVTGQQPIAPASYWEYDLAPPLRTLLHRCFRRRIRLRTLTLIATELAAPFEQGRLFDDPTEIACTRRARAQRLALTLDRLRARFGNRIIQYGNGA